MEIRYYKLLKDKLWGVLKHVVSAQKPRTICELNDEIENACRNISEMTIEDVCCSAMCRYDSGSSLIEFMWKLISSHVPL